MIECYIRCLDVAGKLQPLIIWINLHNNFHWPNLAGSWLVVFSHVNSIFGQDIPVLIKMGWDSI